VLTDQIAANKRRSALLVVVFVVLTTVVVWAVSVLVFAAGWAGVLVALVVSGISAGVAWWSSDKVALAVSRAHPADPQVYRRLYNLVEGLTIAAGLPMPRIYVIDDPAPNAFATGRSPRKAAVAVTTGLLEKMNRVELEGVLAHELSHIRNYDTLVMTVAVTLVGSIIILSDLAIRMMWWNGGRTRRAGDRDDNPAGALIAVFGFLVLLLAPLLARLLQFAMSRQRESLADLSAVHLTRYPPGLISALEKLRDDTTVTHSASRATAHLWIEEPVARTPEEGRLSRFNRLFDTHPPLEERIAALREL
jgi:heat shock protein HtpX